MRVTRLLSMVLLISIVFLIMLLDMTRQNTQVNSIAGQTKDPSPVAVVRLQ